MNREQVLAMKPGRELDLLIAEKIIGWGKYEALNYIPNKYSTDIAAAWEIAKKINDCLHLKEHGAKGNWEAYFCGYQISKVDADTAPEAICKAALLAVIGGD